MIAGTDQVVVSGPAVPETVGVLRAVAASVGARQGMDVATIDEFRITVDEAASLLLRSPGASRLEMSVGARRPLGLEVAVCSDSPDPTLLVGRERSWPWRVISQLATDATLDVGDANTTVNFVVGLGSSV
jgi:hypothetical protein